MRDPLRGSMLVTILTTLLAPVPMLASGDTASAVREDGPILQAQLEVAAMDKLGSTAEQTNSSSEDLRRVWTNDDFMNLIKPREASESKIKPEAPPAAVSNQPSESKEQEPEESPEVQRARIELGPEIAPDFQAREKAFEETIATIKNRLVIETDSSRVEAFQKLLDATISMKKMNGRILEQLGFHLTGESEEGADTKTTDEKPQS
jgi:hypothetical protein